MKVLLINGSPNEHGCTYTALHEVENTLCKNEVDTELFWIGKKPIVGCNACRSCAKTGKCVFEDDVNMLLERIQEFDGIVIGSPVYYAGPNGQLTALLDRLFFVGGKHMAGKLGACVVSCRRGGATAAFDRLNKYFLINNMPVVPSNYWNQVHGQNPEDVVQDEEGMQTLRMLGENMSWLLKCIAAGHAACVPEPAAEPKIRTNFIR